MSEYAVPATGALILNEDNEIFLMKSPKWENKWLVPGGKVDKGESMEQTVRREVKEETGIELDEVEFLDAKDGGNPDDFERDTHFIFLNFVCRAEDPDVELGQREATDYAWIEPEEALRELDLNDSTADFIRNYLGKPKDRNNSRERLLSVMATKDRLKELSDLSSGEKTVDEILEQLRLSAQDKKHDIKLVLQELFFKLDEKESGKEDIERIYGQMEGLADEVEEGQKEVYEEKEVKDFVALFDLGVFYEVLADLGKAAEAENYRSYLEKALEVYEKAEETKGEGLEEDFTIHPHLHRFGTILEDFEEKREDSESMNYRERIEEKKQ